MKECHRCGFNDEDYGCTCPHSDKWYACPIESKKPQNQKALEEYAEWASNYCKKSRINSTSKEIINKS